ncbi:hypothetical protein [Pseudomonas sp.]|uniref:hypothetical protein n=1 Tax=Pseudomonas sp. TaxID=306 RepID=UPI0026399DEF|nr:hypothetical protein [Pseudomonas sp.]
MIDVNTVQELLWINGKYIVLDDNVTVEIDASLTSTRGNVIRNLQPVRDFHDDLASWIANSAFNECYGPTIKAVTLRVNPHNDKCVETALEVASKLIKMIEVANYKRTLKGV